MRAADDAFRRVRSWAWAACLAAFPGLSSAARGEEAPKPVYCVVVSEATHDDAEWRPAVDALARKHAATVIRHAGDPRGALPELRRRLPDFVAFVARPEEASRKFVTGVHRLMREIDDDPFGDALWGIVTGYDAADALRIAGRTEPLVIRRGMSSMGAGLLERTEGGFCSSETDPGAIWKKADGAVAEDRAGRDVARALAAAFDSMPIDYLITSGHATERDWQIGYTKPNGEIRSRRGRLDCVSTRGERFSFTSPNPKVYVAAGNCLIGNIPDREALALAWIHGGGVDQMVGYTVVTFFGYGGWGTSHFFDRGHHTLSEAFFLNTQALLHKLELEFPRGLTLDVPSYQAEAIGPWAGRERLTKDQAGMVWDRDTLAFYGDPAWQARWPKPTTPWTQVLEWGGGRGRFVIETSATGTWPDRPVMAILPERLMNIAVTKGTERSPVVADNFILVPLAGEHAAGERIEIEFTGLPLVRPAR